MRYPVRLDARHLERLSGPLLTGAIELIWNAIDADASEITVILRDNGLGGIGEIEVIDNGHGIDAQTAREGFVALGKSWKADALGSKTLSRPLHGKEGRGRFRLFRHGGVATWESVSKLSGQREKLRVEIRGGDPSIEIEELGRTNEQTYTRVLLTDFGEAPRGLTGTLAEDRLLATFVLPIEEHGLDIVYDEKALDPSKVREGRDELDVLAGSVGKMKMTVIQWSRAIGHQDLYLCDSAGAVLEKTPSHVLAPGMHFTAYLRWEGFSEHPANLAVAELDTGDVAKVIEAARKRLEEHFERVIAERQRRVIGDWQREGVYPFPTGKTGSDSEQVTRDTFDVVALEAAETVNKAPKVTKRLALRLLREALERNPAHIHKVLGEVLTLPEQRLADLTKLLERTRLASIISSSRSIADRLDFLHALGMLTSDAQTKDDVLERQHLHLILEDETWVFGEEYALVASDAGLTQVLEQHLGLIDREQIGAGTVRDAEGKQRRVDLMLAKLIPRAEDLREHLVVELKRPSVAIGPKELQQLKEYALAVASDSRFDANRTKWEFWAVSTQVVGTVKGDRQQAGRPFGLVYDDEEQRIRIWVKTWGEIIHDAEHRLKYVRSQLGVAPDQQSAMAYLRRVHAEKIPKDLQAQELAA